MQNSIFVLVVFPKMVDCQLSDRLLYAIIIRFYLTAIRDEEIQKHDFLCKFNRHIACGDVLGDPVGNTIGKPRFTHC